MTYTHHSGIHNGFGHELSKEAELGAHLLYDAESGGRTKGTRKEPHGTICIQWGTGGSWCEVRGREGGEEVRENLSYLFR